VSGALLYLELQSRANALRGWLRRLRQPRYALGAVALTAYLVFLVFRPMASTSEGSAGAIVGSALVGDFALAFVFVSIAAAWVFGGERSALGFSEADVAWLFPAPIERRTLVHYRILKAQLSVCVGAVLYAAIAAGAGRPFGQRAIGFWVVLSFFQLHGLAGAFTRERLLAWGIGASRRRGVGIALLVLLGVATWLARPAVAAAAVSGGDATGIVGGFAAFLATPPLAWVLAPLRWVFAPLRAASGGELLRALGPALALLAAHYAWALRAMVGFEEASAALAEKRAARVRAARGGSGVLGLRKAKASGDPFALAPRGRPEIAFLWQRVIRAGRWAFPRSLLALLALPVGAALWMRALPEWQSALRTLSGLCVAFAFYGFLFGPALARGSLAQLFERIDLAKSYPLRGWQIVLGELLAPSALLAAIEGVLLTVAALGAGSFLGAPSLVIAAWLGAAALTLPLCALLFGAQLGVQLALPAWFQPSAQPASIEQGGQRLLFVLGSALVFLAALIPAGVAAALLGGVCWLALHDAAVTTGLGALAAALVVVAEVALLLQWLGKRFERIDLASDLAR